MEILFTLLIGPLAFYLLPASLPIWRPFLIVWSLAGIVIVGLWADSVLNPYVRSGPHDWGGSFGKFLIQFFATCWICAGLVQGVRGGARSKGHEGYPHWLMVILGGLGACAIGAFVIG